MPDLSSIYNRHGRYQDAMVAAFEQHLREIVSRAQVRVIARLQERLAITDGLIEQSAGNLRVLRGLSSLFASEMERAGVGALFESFVAEFQGQIPYLQEVLRYLSDQMQTPLPNLDAPLKFTAKDQGILAGFQASTVAALESTVQAAGAAATTRGLFSVGGLRFSELVESVADKFDAGIAQARTIADTSMSTFYRTATDRAFQTIEKGMPANAVKYRYSGPVDKLERPFCRNLTDQDRGYTRAQIDDMNNGQLPSVFVTGGGWNCRHAWIIDTRALAVRALEAA
jgi:hypothetical protein